MKPRTDILCEGSEILSPVLVPHGFAFRVIDAGPSSGGDFACGDFTRGAWRLELHFRFSLGLVCYHHGNISVGHEHYLWAVTGRRAAGEYPGFSDDPLHGFQGLATDLSAYFGAFLRGDVTQFQQICGEATRRAEEWSRMSPLQRLSA